PFRCLLSQSRRNSETNVITGWHRVRLTGTPKPMPINLAPVRAANDREAADDPLMSFEAETDIANEPPASEGPGPMTSPGRTFAASKRPVLIGLLTIVAIALISAVIF